ncbi:transcription factor JUNGBRUNNEN 1-like [Punica granatum]|nr:transcription factor JUNGBRUNNEN 1-like [Punica granatum]PKI75372.1 hypothetical protein CRG98_004256 [Punica granatum]
MKVDENNEVRSLPGFRFHPTDEELVSFYLCRKVDKKPMRIDHLIQQIDIYKHDPWDLPRTENYGGDNKECYFFCKRGRKYRNSVRPNRVTGSGFWKATGIDKPVYSNALGGDRRDQCVIGLKKTLVYYRGCAGKGTKTDWMMHEFRLPSDGPTSSNKCIPHPQETEVWTVCRIFKRNACHKRYSGDWRELPAAKQIPAAMDRISNQTCGISSKSNHSYQDQGYISFNVAPSVPCYPGKANLNNMLVNHDQHVNEKYVQFNGGSQSSLVGQQITTSAASTSNYCYSNFDCPGEHFTDETWDELRDLL